MLKMRRADCYPLEIVIKAACILLIVNESNGDSKRVSYEPSVQKYPSLLRSRVYPNFDTDRPYLPFWYYVRTSQRIQPYIDTSKDRIVFPRDEFVPLPPSAPMRTSIKNPPVCSDSTFCEDTPYYPTELVMRALQTDENLKKLAIVDTVGDIVQRIDADDETPLCISTEQVIYPKTAEKVGGGWLFIAQMHQQNFTQGVRIEKCVGESKPCKVIDGFASGYETKCKQRYIYRQLAAVTENGISSELFRFPSSCCCTVSFVSRTKRNLQQDRQDDTI